MPSNNNSVMDKRLENDLLGRLFRDETVSGRLDYLYNQLKSSKQGAARFQELEQALDECCKGFIPDSVGFHKYMVKASDIAFDMAQPRFEALLNHTAIGGSVPIMLYALLLFREYSKRIKAGYADEGQEPNSFSADKAADNIKKFNLLYCCIMGNGDRFVRAVVDGFSDIEDEYIDDSLEDLDWSQLKDRFMKAVMLRKKSAAFKILGRLSRLDPGESRYFESIAHYNNGEYMDAIRFAKKIPEGSPDYSSAAALILKCYALMGDYKGFFDYLANCIKVKVSNYYLIYLLQVLIYNLRDAREIDECAAAFDTLDGERIIAGAEASDSKNAERSIADSEAEDIVSKRELLRNSAKLALEKIELLDEIELYGSKDESEEIPDELAYRYIKVNNALSVFPELAEQLNNNPSKEKVSEALLCMLLNNYTPLFEDYYTAFEVQRQLGQHDLFIKNVVANAENLLVWQDDRAWKLIEAAYVESVVQNDGESRDKLYRIIEKAGRLDERRLDNYVGDARIRNGLSAPGRIAYESAEWQYRKAAEEDYGWKDAGMLSLAYFRIIELEMNIKIVLPALKAVGYENISQTYNEILSSCNPKDKDYLTKRWGQLMSEFRKISDGIVGGLMLGPLEYLFRIMQESCSYRAPNYVDYKLARLVYGGIAAQFGGPEGQQALSSGRLRSIIRAENRERFRNPPAHTKYLHIEVARECKRFVDESLCQLFAWVN